MRYAAHVVRNAIIGRHTRYSATTQINGQRLFSVSHVIPAGIGLLPQSPNPSLQPTALSPLRAVRPAAELIR